MRWRFAEMRTAVVGHLKRPRRGHRCVPYNDQVIITAGGHRYNASLDMYYDDLINVDFGVCLCRLLVMTSSTRTRCCS